MTDSARQPLFAAILAVMRPIAATLLRFGVGYREFSDICKTAFVDAASEEFGVRGRQTNISRIAAMTGLTRKEVRRIKSLALVTTLPSAASYSAPAEVLHVWHADQRFCSETGTPHPLHFDSGPASFSVLVSSCAGDIPPGAIRAELKRVGAVIEDADGRLVVQRRYYVPVDAGDRLLQGLLFGLRPVAQTVAHNTKPISADERRFQRVVQSRLIPVARQYEVEQCLRKRMGDLSEEVDDYFTEIESASGSDEVMTLGIGLYYYEDGVPDAEGTKESQAS
ncbi:MAG: hypothetical protein KJ049_11415 [Gammaproteobacteria bacterium]|jgi:hypothetical protein|nr:hypothetical protein [Gammaproteobacteria bacterium]